MGRFLMGAAAAMLLMTGVLFWWKGAGRAADPVPPAPSARSLVASDVAADAPVTEPPAATARTREQKRFARYDKDRNGGIVRGEYLANRQKAFAKLDANGDGRLSFDEYSAKAIAKFTAADADRTGVLSANEFATTRTVRKTPTRTRCPEPATARDDDA